MCGCVCQLLLNQHDDDTELHGHGEDGHNDVIVKVIVNLGRSL